MKKIIYFSLVVVFCLVSAPVFAQTSTPSSIVQGTPSATPNPILSRSSALLMGRLQAGLSRAEKISQRIVTRLSKMRTSQTTSGNDITRLDAQQKAFAVVLEQLKIDLGQLDLTSQALSTSSSQKKDYLVFKSQVLTFINNLKGIYQLEVNLVANMKQITSVSATPSAKVTPVQ